MNEKKAYFEAQFRKKIVSEKQTGTERQNSDHDASESTDYGEEVQFVNKDSQCWHFDGSPVSSANGGGETEVRSNYVEVSRTAEMPIEVDVTVDIVLAEDSEKTGITTEQRPGGDEKEVEVSSEVISLLQNNDKSETISIAERNHPAPEVWNEFNWCFCIILNLLEVWPLVLFSWS